jgi:hypothetical protein
VSAGLPGLDGAGKLDRPAEEEEFFGERRLPRIGVADDAEGPALIDLLLLSSIHLEDGRRRLRGASGLNIHNLFLFRFHDEKKSPTAKTGSGDGNFQKPGHFLLHQETFVKLFDDVAAMLKFLTSVRSHHNLSAAANGVYNLQCAIVRPNEPGMEE